jgi:hypothetical protein
LRQQQASVFSLYGKGVKQMDPTTIQTLADGVLAILVPVITKVTSVAAAPITATGGELIKLLSQAAGDKIATMMKTVIAKFKDRPAAAEVIGDLARAPQDKDVQAAFRLQLRKALEADPAFADELHKLLQAAESESSTDSIVTASGERSVAAGRDVNAPIITGDVKGDVKIEK